MHQVRRDSEGHGSQHNNPVDHKRTKKVIRVPPNYFIGFRVYNPDIHHEVKNFQSALFEKKPHLYPTLIRVASLHITLAVTHLADEKEIEIVKKLLEEWGNKNVESMIKNPIKLNFKGIETFGGRVAYLNLEQCENYDRICNLASEMQNMLKAEGFPEYSREGKFVPHCTILKVRDSSLLPRETKIDINMLKKCEKYFGSQLVSHVQLLSMYDPKDETGYYKCLYQVDACDSPIPEFDHRDCCEPIPEPEPELLSWRKECASRS